MSKLFNQINTFPITIQFLGCRANSINVAAATAGVEGKLHCRRLVVVFPYIVYTLSALLFFFSFCHQFIQKLHFLLFTIQCIYWNIKCIKRCYFDCYCSVFLSTPWFATAERIKKWVLQCYKEEERELKRDTPMNEQSINEWCGYLIRKV